MHKLPSRERSETRLLLVISVKKAGKRSNVTYSSFGLTPSLALLKRTRKSQAEHPLSAAGGQDHRSTRARPPPTRDLSAHANFTRPRHARQKRQPRSPNFATLFSSALPFDSLRARGEGPKSSVRTPRGQPPRQARGQPRGRGGPRGRQGGRTASARGATTAKRPPLWSRPGVLTLPTVARLRPAAAAPEPRTGVGSRSSSLEKSGGPLLLAPAASGGRLRAVRCCR